MYIVDKFKKILQIQKAHFQKRGASNVALGYTLLFTIFWLAHHYGSQIWPQHVEDKPFFVFMGSIVLHTGAQIVSLAIYLPGYLGLSSYKRYEISKQLKWPWQRQNWPLVLKKTILNFILIQLLIYPLVLYFSNSSGIRVRFDNFPSFWQNFTQIFLIYFIEDFFFYWSHRSLHTFKPLYKFHKVHHYVLIFGSDRLRSSKFSTIEFIKFPALIGLFILGTRIHCFTFFFWISWKIMMINQGHSGYQFPWSPTRILPLITGSSYHDHHHSKNVGNYAATCYFWDLMLETGEKYFDELLAQKKQK